MEKLTEYAAVCTVGSVGYSAIEVLWRGFTHWTMALTGGVGFLLLYLTDLRMTGRSMLQKCAAGSLVLTAVEFVAGCIINRGCRLGVWDYSRRKGNLLGQICPLYSALWFLLCIPVLPLSRALRERRSPGDCRARRGPGSRLCAALRGRSGVHRTGRLRRVAHRGFPQAAARAGGYLHTKSR